MPFSPAAPPRWTLNGDFPESLKDIFLGQGGLFPQPREISFNCSCPDWAMMCKHVAATLYAIGTRLDEEPLLFFTLRGIEMDPFVDVVVHNRIESMLSNVDKPSSRIITKPGWEKMFRRLLSRIRCISRLSSRGDRRLFVPKFPMEQGLSLYTAVQKC